MVRVPKAVNSDLAYLPETRAAASLNIAAQVLNAFLLPLVIGFLVALAVKALPESLRLRGFYLWVLIGISAIVIAVGLFGGVSGLL